MKVRIVVAVHRRPRITEIFYHGINRLRSELISCEIDISMTVAYTEEEDRELALACLNDDVPVTFVQTPNVVSNKHNAAFLHAMKDQWDALMIMGSDDLISSCGVWNLASRVGNLNYCGYESIFFHNSHTKEYREFRYKGDKLIGCGRMVSRKACNKIVNVGRKTLWTPDLSSGLDRDSSANLLRLGYKQHVLDYKTCMLDIKSTHNITNFQLIHFLSKEVNRDEATWFLSEKEKVLLSLLV